MYWVKKKHKLGSLHTFLLIHSHYRSLQKSYVLILCVGSAVGIGVQR